MLKASCKALSFLVLMTASASAATLPGPRASAHIEVDRQGQLLSIEWVKSSADLNPSLRDALEAQLRGLPWEIDPAQVEGSRFGTNVAITSSLEEDGSDLVLSLDTIYVGPAYGRVKPPRYPSSAVGQSRESEVLAIVTISDEGIPLEITYSAYSRQARAFQENVTSTLKKWTFKPESVDGVKVGGVVKVPTIFSMNCRRSSDSHWGVGETQTAIVRIGPVQGLTQQIYADAIEVVARRAVSRTRKPMAPPLCEPSEHRSDG